VYYAFTTPAAWRQWCDADARTDPCPGGRLYVYTPGYAAIGEFTALEENKTVAFTWDGQGEPPTRVHVALQERDGGTHVTFTVTGLGAEQAWAETAHVFESAWGRALANLQSVLETGLGVPAGPSASDLPPTARALAKALRPVYARLDAELAGIFAGVSESQAAQPPAHSAWSAKETLAHLVATERAAHAWAALMTLGLDIDQWGNAVRPWISAIAEGHPTVPELLEALKGARAETLRMLAALPDEFVGHKGSYAQVGLVFLQKLPAHTRAHFEQIRAAIEAV
jgi:uncharacterized protein YndB with AHSA1/START domain